jgi:hypothetical protein
LTLKQIISRLEELALSHLQVNHFFCGAADEFLDDADVVYPAIFAELKPDNSINLTNRVTNYNFTFYVLDLLDVSDNALQNQWEISSDLTQIAQDYLAMLYDTSYTDWDINDSYNIEIKKYQLQDLCGGIKVDVTIGSKFDADRCQVPTDYTFADYTDANLTLKQIITRLETLALSHKQINHYFLGDFDEFLDSTDVNYPACFAELNRTGNIALTDRLAKYQFTFYFFDLLDIANNALQNEWEVKSDMSSVAQDFIAMLNYNGFAWQLNTEYTMSVNDYELQDLCAGVSVTVQIGARFDANLCQVPSTDAGNFLLWDDGQYFLINNNDKLIYAE